MRRGARSINGSALGYAVIAMLVCTMLIFAILGVQAADFRVTQRESERMAQKAGFDGVGERLVDKYRPILTSEEFEGSSEEFPDMDFQPYSVSCLLTGAENGDRIAEFDITLTETTNRRLYITLEYGGDGVKIVRWQYV